MTYFGALRGQGDFHAKQIVHDFMYVLSLYVDLANKLYPVGGKSCVLFPDGRRIANHETVESDPDVLELKPLTVSPRMGATDGATDDPPSLISGFRLVVASNVVPVKVWHKPATAEHFRIPPMTVPSAAFCPRV